MKKKNKNQENKKEETSKPEEQAAPEEAQALPEESHEVVSPELVTKDFSEEEEIVKTEETQSSESPKPEESPAASEPTEEVAAEGSSGSGSNLFVILLILGLAGFAYYLVKDRKETLKEFQENFAKIDAQISSLKSNGGMSQTPQDASALQAELQSFKDETSKVLADQNEAINKLSSFTLEHGTTDTEESVDTNEEAPQAAAHSDVSPSEEVLSPEEEHIEESKAESESHGGEEHAEESHEAPTKEANIESDVIPALGGPADSESHGGEDHTEASYAEAKSHEGGEYAEESHEAPAKEARAESDVISALEPADSESHGGEEHAEDSHAEAEDHGKEFHAEVELHEDEEHAEETHAEAEDHGEESHVEAESHKGEEHAEESSGHAVSHSTGADENSAIQRYLEKVETFSSKLFNTAKDGVQNVFGFIK
jgi:hypothetical protein